MEQIILKTYPRLFYLSMTFLGSTFFGLLAWLLWIASINNRTPIADIVLIIFLLGSIISFYYFITIKIIKLSKDSIKISYFFLPFQNTFLLSEIKSFYQEFKAVKVDRGFSSKITFADFTTIIHFINGSKIKLHTISNMDFQEIDKGIQLLKNTNQTFKPSKKSSLTYIIDNSDGIGLIILTFILTLGLAYGLLTRH